MSMNEMVWEKEYIDKMKVRFRLSMDIFVEDTFHEISSRIEMDGAGYIADFRLSFFIHFRFNLSRITRLDNNNFE